MGSTDSTRRSARLAIVIGVVIVIGLIARIAYLSELERSPYADLLSLDSRFYRDLASSMIAGEKFPGGALTFNPLYPFFLVVVFKLFGKGLLAARVVQLLLGLATVAVISLAGSRLVEGPRKGRPSGGTTAAAAACMAILYAPFVLYEGMLVSTAIEVFLVTVAFALSLAADLDIRGVQPMRVAGRRVPLPLATFVLGGILGAGALARPNLFLLLALAVPLWLLARHRRKRRGLVPALACVLGVLVFLSPPIVHNARGTGRFVPVTAHGGINFYIGNRSGTLGTYDPPADMRGDMRGLIEDARERAEAGVGHSLTDGEVSDYYFRRTVEAIKADPAAWLRLLGRKFLLFWNGAEVPDLPNAFFYEQAAPVLRILCLPFAVVAALAIAGLVVLWRSGRNRSLVLLFVGAGLASVLPFFVNARYRLPLVPVLMLAAAFFIAWAAKELSRKRLRNVTLMVALAGGVFFVSTRTIVEINKSAAYAFLGNYHIERGEETKAEEAFGEAYRLDPNQVESMINYARVLRRRGELDASASLYARAYAIMPRFPRLAAEYGSVIERLGRRDEARRLYLEELASTRARERVLACQLLADLALSEGKRDESIGWVKRALEMAPGDRRLAETLERLERSP